MNSDTIPISNRMPPEAVSVLIVLGAMAAVALIVFFCVLVFRKDVGKRHHHHHHHHHRRESYREQIQKTATGIKDLIRQHRRRSHREHRPINPTLAQTGGLPPIRSPDQPPGSPPPSAPKP